MFIFSHVNTSCVNFWRRVANQGITSVLCPVARLRPTGYRWTIKAGVINKNEIETSMNSREGKVFEEKVFHIHFHDTSGVIRASAFSGNVDQFHRILEVRKVYLINNLVVKKVNVGGYKLRFLKSTKISTIGDICFTVCIYYLFVFWMFDLLFIIFTLF